MSVTKPRRYAPLLSLVRFGPGTIVVLFLIILVTVALCASGLVYFAVVSGAVGLLLFGVKLMEMIEPGSPENMMLIGRRCLIVKDVGKGKTGVVRVYGRNGRLEPELWSAESAHEIPEGQEAEVAGMRNIVLLITPPSKYIVNETNT
jgi:membrane protein implicated in regulation of membrane protease activity